MVNGNIRITESNESGKNGTLRLPKVGEVRIKLHRKMAKAHVIKSVTVSREASGKYYASILTEYTEGPATQTITPDAQNIMALGLDYSSGEFYVDSEGRKAEMPHFYRNTEEKLSREQRRLSKMKKGSGCLPCESSHNRGARGDSSFMLDAMASSSEKPPLQMRSIKWWEYVTKHTAAMFPAGSLLCQKL